MTMPVPICTPIRPCRDQIFGTDCCSLPGSRHLSAERLMQLQTDADADAGTDLIHLVAVPGGMTNEFVSR